jgi:dGTPase
MINTLVTDMISQTLANIETSAPQSLEEVRCAPALAAFSPRIRELNNELKSFLRTELYRHYRVMRMSAKARRVIRELFHAFMGDPRLLPPQSGSQKAEDLPRTVADYIAGMTDRYAIREHRRIFAIEEI